MTVQILQNKINANAEAKLKKAIYEALKYITSGQLCYNDTEVKIVNVPEAKVRPAESGKVGFYDVKVRVDGFKEAAEKFMLNKHIEFYQKQETEQHLKQIEELQRQVQDLQARLDEQSL